MKRALINLSPVHLVAVLLVVLPVVSCYDPTHTVSKDNTEIKRKNVAKHKPGTSFSDTVEIDIPAVIFFKPDSIQLGKIKEVTDPSIFESTMHECFYQIKNSRNVVKQYYPGLKIIEAINVRYVLFRKTDGKVDYMDLNALNDPCGMIIFDGRKDPELIDMSNAESRLGFYFSK